MERTTGCAECRGVIVDISPWAKLVDVRRCEVNTLLEVWQNAVKGPTLVTNQVCPLLVGLFATSELLIKKSPR